MGVAIVPAGAAAARTSAAEMPATRIFMERKSVLLTLKSPSLVSESFSNYRSRGTSAQPLSQDFWKIGGYIVDEFDRMRPLESTYLRDQSTPWWDLSVGRRVLWRLLCC
jgi:hypothetical protein